MIRWTFGLLFIALSGIAGFAQSLKWEEDSDCIEIAEIRLTGNTITKDYIIHRELTFQVGDCLRKWDFYAQLDQSRDNLMNTTLFNFVEYAISGLHFEDSVKGPVVVEFRFTERWYLWVAPILTYEDRNFSIWLAEGDWSRVSFGMTISHNNFRGRMERLALSLQYGYDRQAWLEYSLPYINSAKTIGLSIAGGVEYLHEAPYATSKGKRQFFSDKSLYMLNRTFAIAALTIRPKIHSSHYFSLGFENIHWGDTLLSLNPGLTSSGSPHERYLRFHYKLKLDYRDYASYPLEGWYADLELQKEGFGLFEAGGPDYFFVKSTLRKYQRIGLRSYVAAGAHLKLGSSGAVPYYLNKGLGYSRDFARGYEYYVVDGQAFALAKVNLKYTIVKPRVFEIPVPLTERITKLHYALYFNLHADLGRVRDRYSLTGNFLANQWLYSGGSGIDFVTYYDKVFRIDYSVNHLGEGGIFIHFIAPI